MSDASADMIADFGATLRQLRVARAMTLGTLAASVHYSTGHMSHIEHGRKRPSELLARLCDGVLETGGILVRHPAVAAEPEPGPDLDTPPLASLTASPFVLRVDADGSGSWDVAGVSHALRMGPSSMDEQWAFFAAIRGLGRSSPPAAVLPMATVFFSSVRSSVNDSIGADRRQQILLGARLAEYLGWMWQEAGSDVEALLWTDRAVELAGCADDTELCDYAAARRALVMLYRRDAKQVVALTERVAPTASPRVRWLSALREAQGHALAGDYGGCMDALDRARRLSDAVSSDVPAVLGPAAGGNRMAAVTGWCLYDLGRPAEAIDPLRSALATIAPGTREHPRFGVRLALAQVAAGDVEAGCETMAGLLDTVIRVDSATIRTDLVSFGHVIDRYHRNPLAAALRQRMSVALFPNG
jgi:hypothetical protein